MMKRQSVYYNNDTDKLERFGGKSETGFKEIDIGGGQSVTIPDTAYASNAEARVDLEAGRLYQSTTLINGSPIILITV